MLHQLGPCHFSVPDDWRDKTTYSYTSPDEKTVLVVEQTTTRESAARLLDLAKREYVAVWGPLILYVNVISVKDEAGGAHPAIEGGQRSLVSSEPPQRFAIAVVANPERTVFLRLLGPSTPEFLSLLRKIVRGTELPGDVAQVHKTWTRHRADQVELALPPTWQAPLNRMFLGPHSDALRLDVSIAHPMASEGSADLSQIMPGRFQVLQEEVRRAGQEPTVGWVGEWSLEHVDHPKYRFVRKMMLTSSSDSGAVTIVGQAPETLRADLDVAWNETTATLSLVPSF